MRDLRSRLSFGSASVVVFVLLSGSEGVFGTRADWKTLRSSCWRGSGIVVVSRGLSGCLLPSAGFFLSGKGFLAGLLFDGGFLLLGRGGMAVVDAVEFSPAADVLLRWPHTESTELNIIVILFTIHSGH